jgi:hypothetical protein
MFLPTILFQPAIGSVKFRRVIPFSESEQSNVGTLSAEFMENGGSDLTCSHPATHNRAPDRCALSQPLSLACLQFPTTSTWKLLSTGETFNEAGLPFVIGVFISAP